MSGVSFVSETEIEDVRKKKQEEWEKVRKESDPIGKLNYLVEDFLVKVELIRRNIFITNTNYSVPSYLFIMQIL